MGIEYGEKLPRLVVIICQGHGEIGEVPQSEVNDSVAAHRENLGCYYKITLGFKKIDDLKPTSS